MSLTLIIGFFGAYVLAAFVAACFVGSYIKFGTAEPEVSEPQRVTLRRAAGGV